MLQGPEINDKTSLHGTLANAYMEMKNRQNQQMPFTKMNMITGRKSPQLPPQCKNGPKLTCGL